jgi:hypothetical protein
MLSVTFMPNLDSTGNCSCSFEVIQLAGACSDLQLRTLVTTAVGIRNCCRNPLASGMENIQSNSSKPRSRAGLVAVVPPRIQPAFEVTSRSTEPGSRPCPQLSSNADRHRFISISAYNHIMAASFTAQCGSARCGAFSSSKQRAPAAAVRAPTRSRQLVTRVQAAQKPPKQQMLVSRTSTPASLHHSSCCNINIACCRGHFTARLTGKRPNAAIVTPASSCSQSPTEYLY